MKKFYNAAGSRLVPLFACALCIGSSRSSVHADDTTGTIITRRKALTFSPANTIVAWWATLDGPKRSKLANIFNPAWFNALDVAEQAGYAHLANTLYEFVGSGADSHPHDGYISFSPLLLKASFHGAGSLDVPSGTGGTNGGTIFSAGELEGGGNACIDIATRRLETLLTDSTNLISKADALVIAGSVALDDMNFPRMDLLQITGGRKDDTTGIAFRDRLPSPDDNPTDLFVNAYNLNLSELTALIGGAHNFGSAHGVCSGYVGQWTSGPLNWNSPEGESSGESSPEFFPDLMREDWRWYEVCTYQNGTSVYVSIDDPFANGEPEAEEEEHDEEPTAQCDLENNVVPFICEEQAMRGCDFEDGSYDATESPCDLSLLQFRLKSDFFLKADPDLRPFAQLFADDSAVLAEQFGVAYHKLTHAGLDRCGLFGSSSSLSGGCGDLSICVDVYDDNGRYLMSQCEIDEAKVLEAAMARLEGEGDDVDDRWSLDHSGSIFVLVALIVSVFGFVFLAAKTSSSSTTDASANNPSKTPETMTTGGDDSSSADGKQDVPIDNAQA